MSRRTIQSPGIEIREIDLTTRPAPPLGTSVFVAGFSDQGPTDEIINVGTFAEFQEIFGEPTNAAERYFYHSAKQLYNSDANVYVSRLPYGASSGAQTRSALVYPVASLKTYSISSVDINGSDVDVKLNTAGNDTALDNDLNGNEDEKGHFEIITRDSNDQLKTYTFTHEFLTFDNSTDTISVSGNTPQLSAIAGETLVNAQVYFSTSSLKGTNTTYSSSDKYYVIGEPTQVELSQSEYDDILKGNLTWSSTAAAGSFDGSTLGGAGLIVLNTGETTINPRFEGYYLGLTDNSNTNPATDYDSVGAIYTTTSTGDIAPANYTAIPTSRVGFALSAAQDSASNRSGEEVRSVSKTLETISDFNLGNGGFADSLNIGLFKVRVSPLGNSDTELTSFLAESYTGSLNSFRRIQNQNGGNLKSFFVGDIENNSPNIKILVNPNISKENGDWTSNTGDAPSKFVRVLRSTGSSNSEIVKQYAAETPAIGSKLLQGLFPLGNYADNNNTAAQKTIGNIHEKLERILSVAANVDQFNIDVSIEAGLGTIAAFVTNNVYDDTAYQSGIDSLYVVEEGSLTTAGNDLITKYRDVFNKFENFARQTRKDHIFIADPLRHIFVQGENRKVLDDKTKYFSKHIYWPLRHQFGFANSNFATVYGNWAQTFDGASNSAVWVPFSGIAGKIYANNDANFAPWYAPAGFNRGIVSGATDIAVSPTQRQRDQLYRIAVNPVTQFPAEGIVIFGQKTLQRRPSAFDRVNVRRLFLDLEKRTRETLKYFIFEPNTFLTRNKVVNTLTPIFENCKQTEGIYDYLIVCDDRNNTADRIDNNELHVDIYLKPVRAAEFILVNFYAVNTDVNFEEIVSQ